MKEGKDPTLDPLSERIIQILREAGDFEPVLSSALNELLFEDPDQWAHNDIATRLNRAGEEIDRALSALPPGIHKARLGAREAFLFTPTIALAALLSKQPEGQYLADLSRACDQKLARHPAPLLSAMFTLDLAEPKSALHAGAIDEFRSLAIAAAQDAEGCEPRLHILPIGGDVHWLLNLAPRRSELVLPLLMPMRSLVHQLVPFQSPFGYWFYDKDAPVPLVFYTVGIAHSLAIFGDRRDQLVGDAINRALLWLEHAQNADGGWPIRVGDDASDVLTSALAADLMRRSGRSGCYGRAVAYLIDQQHLAGLWHSPPSDADAVSAIVFEVIEERLSPIPELDHRLSLSRDLLAKAFELSRTNDGVSAQIAAMTAHQAIEMFLYSALEALDPPGEIWQPNGQQTIGLRVAMKELGDRLFGLDQIALSRKSQVLQLASARDGIVHKGQLVSPDSVLCYIDDAIKFISAASTRVLKFDLLG